MLSKKERIYNAVNNERVDLYPFSFWTHLPGIDLDPVQLAETTYQFYKKYDIDLIKTMNNGMYAIQDYGCEIDYSDIVKGGVAKVISTPVKTEEDLFLIQPKSLEECESLKRELYSLQLLLQKVRDEEVPVIFTVFSPLTTLDKLTSGKLLKMISQDSREIIHTALTNITDTTVQLVKAANSLGASGIYMATQLSSYDKCSEEIYREYGQHYDETVLNASAGFADTLHCHGENIMFDILKDYPVDIFNWHAFQSNPTLSEAREANKCIMSGIVRDDITNSNWNNIVSQIDECAEVYQGKGHIFSAGCVIRYPVNEDILQNCKEYIRNIKL